MRQPLWAADQPQGGLAKPEAGKLPSTIFSPLTEAKGGSRLGEEKSKPSHWWRPRLTVALAEFQGRVSA